MLKKIRKVIHEYQMVTAGDKVLVCVSGGADSICLLYALIQLKEEYPIELSVIHVNHQLRGTDAFKEEQYVLDFCRQAGIPAVVEYADVKETADKMKWSIEEAGRNLRYQLFDKACVQFGCNKIAVAHHLEDVAETVLFYMFRGTGLRGMQGIQPVRDKIIRPLIEADKQEIEDFLNKNHIKWCVDKSNFTDTYTRNKIRNQILSYAKKEINSQASLNIFKLTKQMTELYDFICIEVKKAYQESVTVHNDSFFIEIERFKHYPVVIQKELLVFVLSACTEKRKDISSIHIEDLLKLFTKQSGTLLNLQGRVSARREFGHVVLKKQLTTNTFIQNEIIIQSEGTFMLSWLDKFLKIDMIKYNNSMIIPKNNYTKWFDYDKIDSVIKLRTKMEHDVIQINKIGGHKSIKALLIEQKISLDLRDQILVLAAGNNVLWIPGIRASEGYYVDEFTKTVLVVQITA